LLNILIIKDMMHPQLKSFFNRIVPFTDKELDAIADKFTTKTLKKGELLLSEGEIAYEFGFIVKGIFRIYYLNDGKETTRYLGTENTLISSAQSFTTQKPSIEFVQALENSELLMISYKDLQNIYNSSAKWERMGRIFAEKSYNSLQSHIYSIISLPAIDRYHNFCEKYPDIVKRVPQYIIASFLGVSPETVSRIRKK
jgi:CRP-like cAMP-binding protein